MDSPHVVALLLGQTERTLWYTPLIPARHTLSRTIVSTTTTTKTTTNPHGVHTVRVSSILTYCHYHCSSPSGLCHRHCMGQVQRQWMTAYCVALKLILPSSTAHTPISPSCLLPCTQRYTVNRLDLPHKIKSEEYARFAKASKRDFGKGSLALWVP